MPRRRSVRRSFTSARTWFQCSVYPERHPPDSPEIEEHFLTVSVRTAQISEANVIDKHDDYFGHHVILDYRMGRPWHRRERG